MAVSRYGRKAAETDEPTAPHAQVQDKGQPNTKDTAKARSSSKQKPANNAVAQTSPKETPFWEKMVGVLGLLIVLGILGFLLYEAFQPQSEAQIVTEVQSISPQPGGYLVQFEASNHGRQTAAAILIEGALYDPASPDEPIETAEVTFDYIPDQSDRTGAFVFEHDPREYDLRLQVKGFMDP
jgi:uncharacterized protein (TIGR02588 family)